MIEHQIKSKQPGLSGPELAVPRDPATAPLSLGLAAILAEIDSRR